MKVSAALKEGFVAQWQPDEQQFRAILAGLDEALLIYEADGTLNYVNPAALDDKYRYLHPQSLEALAPSFELRTLEGEPIPDAEHPLRRALRGETFSTLEFRVKDEDSGTHLLHACSAWIVDDGGSRLYVVKADDVTEHREAEERFSVCFNDSPIPTLIISLVNFDVLDVNGGFLSMTGYTREEVIGNDFTALELFADMSEREQLLETLSGEVSEGSMQEFKLRARGGEVYHILIYNQPITLRGEPCLLGSLVDITERKRSEEQLMQALQEVMQDTTWFSRSVLDKLAQIKTGTSDRGETVDLTERERQVLGLVAKGLDNKQLRAELGLAQNTIRNYLAKIYEKLGVHSRAEAVVWARERGIIAP